MKLDFPYPTIRAVIPAGGVGSRAAAMVNGQAIPKQYRLIKGRSMLWHTVQALLAHPAIESVHIGVAADDDWILQQILPERCYIHRTGGATRADTVLNTISTLPNEGWVLVHDAARPGLPFDALNRLITSCLSMDTGGILALPVGDTVKRQQRLSEKPLSDMTTNAYIEETVSRDGLWLAQTPQLFKKELLEQALRVALSQGFEITDEASAIEFVGEKSLLIKGHWRNLKVTWAEDFELVESFLT